MAMIENEQAHRLIERDEVLGALFLIEVEPAQETTQVHDGGLIRLQPRVFAILACKGPGCSASWEVELVNGACPVGARNSMLAHAAVHAPGYRKGFRRRT